MEILNSSKWFQILEKAIQQVMIESPDQTIDSVYLFNMEEGHSSVLVNQRSIENEYFKIFDQSWAFLNQILTNELQLNKWKTFTITGRSRALTIKSLAPIPNSILLMFIHDISTDINEFLQLLMKHVVEIEYKQNYNIIGLVTSEGFPIWSISEEQTVDDFLFALSITSLLNILERMDMEVSANASSCIIHGNDGLILNISYNPSKDLVLAVTQRGTTETEDDPEGLEEELATLYRSITDPNMFNAFVSDIVDPEREKILAEILQDEMIGEITEEEMSTLNIFDAETIDSLVKEILAVSRNYGADQISVGYLRKRMKLPSEVLHVALEYLISTEAIRGRIGRERLSGKEILVLQSHNQITDDEKQTISNVQSQIKDLFLPIDGYLQQIPALVTTSDKPEIITGALSEFQVLQSLSDTDSLFLFTADLRILGGRLERSAKRISMLQEQVTENIGNEEFLQELKTQLDLQIERFTNLRSTITTSSNKLHTDILNAYRILLRILPIPSIIKFNTAINKSSLLFKCGVIGCEQFLYYYDDNANRWKQLIYFAHVLELIDSFPEGWDKKDNSELDQTFMKLLSIARSEEENTSLDTFAFLNDLDNLIISNVQRDSIIADLRKKVYNQSNDQIDYYSFFKQCGKCQKWYCQKHIQSDDKCVYC